MCNPLMGEASISNLDDKCFHRGFVLYIFRYHMTKNAVLGCIERGVGTLLRFERRAVSEDWGRFSFL